jgi:hypothetical protein
MAGILKHRYTNPHADVAGSTKTQASHWNDFLMATGGVHGDALTRDTSDATYGMKWTSGGVAGVWQNVAFTAADFAGFSPMTWTVTSGQVSLNSYTLIGKTLIWSLVLAGSTLGGTASGRLELKVPAGLTVAVSNPVRVTACLNAAILVEAELYNTAGTILSLFKLPSTNFTVGTLDLRFTSIFTVF